MRAHDLATVFDQLPARYPELRGRVALVTGASRGIGLGIAARLAREGMKLVLSGLDAIEVTEAGTALHELGADVTGVAGDLSEAAFCRRLVDVALETFGGLHLLVNNAADIRRARVRELPPELIDSQWLINARAPLLLSLRAAEVMQSDSDSSIVNISSVGAGRSQLPGLPYGMMKGAVEAMTRNLAMDLGEHGIRVNAVAPGWTPMNLDPNSAADSDYVRDVARYISLNKPGRPQDIGAAVAFLASTDASYITGHVLVVDGGLSMQLHPPDQPI
ncbi:MAG: SDR family oxidoreductase [Anaerolineae bacterium]|nr:SDR family oxidoreductase [Anaerolineae bacterium]